MRRSLYLGEGLWFALLAALTGLSSPAPARADITVLLEEPYAVDGELAGTGHTAVYLNNVCASSPTVLRRCQPGETGVVLSRYHHIAGYDWLAIPLLPYLYAIERPEDIPLIADAKIEAAMRDAYRRKYLQDLVPDGPEGETPGGDWYELVGSAFDRTLFGFQFATTAERDDAFIAAYNARPNRMAYKLVTSNCADFVRDAMNFYYPKAATRSIFADLDVATPKHVAKSVVSYAHHHPQVPFSAFVIPQIPGSIKRSTPIHGVVDSVFKAKKYEIPLLVFHPFVGGGFAVAYVVSGRFNPAQNAMMFSPDGALEQPLTRQQRRDYAKGLEELLRSQPDAVIAQRDSGSNARNKLAPWRDLRANASFATDAAGHPALAIASGKFAGTVDGRSADVSGLPPTLLGLTRNNILESTASPALARDLLVIRLRQELSKGTAPHTSEREFRADLDLLEKLLAAQNQTIAAAASVAGAER
ncbi:MAG TPA: hypothetical protein VKF79_05835 [Candidatus Acidoferrum sp.]|nr:hypothetical protein [Candidatus Acidoferrum sp.]